MLDDGSGLGGRKQHRRTFAERERGLEPHSGIIVVFLPNAVTGSRCCSGQDRFGAVLQAPRAW